MKLSVERRKTIAAPSHAGPGLAPLSLLLAMVGLATLLLSAAPAEERHISIYSPVANYSLNVSERDGQDYVGLLEILEPLGSINAKTEGQKWKLRFNNTEAQFTQGGTRARFQARDVDLPSRFLMENGRGLVPVDSLNSLLPHFLGIPIVFHVSGRRIFIGEIGTTYLAELSKTTPPKLVMNFSSPVNPTIGTEPGKLNMVFARDPLVSSGPDTVNFNDKTISSATFRENNGVAEITLSGSVALLASFSNDGRTITIAPVPAPAAPQAQTPAPVPAAPITAAPGGASQPAGTRRILAVIDASHGGGESGATFSNQLLEKDVTLAFARHLRKELENRGVWVLMVRDSDGTLSLDQRASVTNTAHSALYIAVHAANDGPGVRVYTALIPAWGENRGPFLAWNSAASSFLSISQTAAASVATELRKKEIPTRTLAAPLRPLNNVTTAAFAIEVAPQNGDIGDLTSPAYQQLVAGSVASGVAAVRDRLEAGH